MENDASLVEINPLALTTKGMLIAIDAKIVFDDNALCRHPEIHALFDPTEEEKVEADAKERGFSYVRMDGNIGCMVNGAGLAMATMDMIKIYGGNPANFLDIGGSSNPIKVVEAMKLLLQDEKVKVVLINIFGGITRSDDVAIGLIQSFEQIKSEIPIIVRLTGTNENIGRYTDEDFLNDVFLDEQELKTLKSILKYKKNIILQGAPGVGKTYSAKRLAYTIMRNNINKK